MVKFAPKHKYNLLNIQTLGDGTLENHIIDQNPHMIYDGLGWPVCKDPRQTMAKQNKDLFKAIFWKDIIKAHLDDGAEDMCKYLEEEILGKIGSSEKQELQDFYKRIINTIPVFDLHKETEAIRKKDLEAIGIADNLRYLNDILIEINDADRGFFISAAKSLRGSKNKTEQLELTDEIKQHLVDRIHLSYIWNDKLLDWFDKKEEIKRSYDIELKHDLTTDLINLENEMQDLEDKGAFGCYLSTLKVRHLEQQGNKLEDAISGFYKIPSFSKNQDHDVILLWTDKENWKKVTALCHKCGNLKYKQGWQYGSKSTGNKKEIVMAEKTDAHGNRALLKHGWFLYRPTSEAMKFYFNNLKLSDDDFNHALGKEMKPGKFKEWFTLDKDLVKSPKEFTIKDDKTFLAALYHSAVQNAKSKLYSRIKDYKIREDLVKESEEKTENYTLVRPDNSITWEDKPFLGYKIRKDKQGIFYKIPTNTYKSWRSTKGLFRDKINSINQFQKGLVKLAIGEL